MRTTLNINDEMLKKASSLTGIKEKTSLIRHALENLISSESAKRLARLAVSENKLRPIQRRRSAHELINHGPC